MGWAAGFRAGSDVAQRAMDNYGKQQLKQGLTQEAAKYDVVEGAAGPELEQNIQQVQGLKQQAIAGGMTPDMAAQQYDPSIAELTRRSGLTQPDFSISQAGRGPDGNAINYATRQEARQAAAPLRSEGLASVYRREGDIEGADRLEARALDQQRGLQQYELGQYQLGAAKTTADRVAGVTEAEKAASDYIKKQAGARGGFNSLTEEDYNVATQNQINALRAKGYQAEANALVEGRAKAITMNIAGENAQYTQALGQVLASKDLNGFGQLYDKYVKDGARVTGVVQNKDGSITVNRELDNGDETEPVVFDNFEKLAASANSLTDPKYMATFSQQQFDNNLKSAAVETQKSQFAAQMGVRKDELALSGQRLGVDLARLEIAAKDSARKTLPGQIKELEDIGIALSDDDKKSLGGVKADADPLLKAELEVIASLAKNDMSGADKMGLFQQSSRDALKRANVRKQTKEVVTGLQRAEKDGKGPEAVAQLRSMGMSEAAIQAAAASAGVKYVAPPQPPVVGLDYNARTTEPNIPLGQRPDDDFTLVGP